MTRGVMPHSDAQALYRKITAANDGADCSSDTPLPPPPPPPRCFSILAQCRRPTDSCAAGVASGYDAFVREINDGLAFVQFEIRAAVSPVRTLAMHAPATTGSTCRAMQCCLCIRCQCCFEVSYKLDSMPAYLRLTLELAGDRLSCRWMSSATSGS